MGFFSKVKIRAKLHFITSLIMVSIVLIIAIIISNAEAIQKDFTEYDKAAVESQKLILMINRDMNYISRLSRSIMLGDDFDSNFKKLASTKKNIQEHFLNLNRAIKSITNKSTYEDLTILVKKSESDTMAFLNDGYDRMATLATVERTTPVLSQAWIGYKKGASPFAINARKSFSELVAYQSTVRDNLKQSAMNSIAKMTTNTMVVGVAFLLITAPAIMFISKGIISSVEKVKSKVESIEKSSDLAQRIKITSNDELGSLSESLNLMLATFQSSIQTVSETSNSLANTAEQVAGTTFKTAQSVSGQQSELNIVATAISEMTRKNKEVSEYASNAESYAKDSDKQAQKGQQVVKTAINAINTLASEINSASVIIKELKDDSNKIGNILDVIESIAEQTNLLALNAAIEAARAGEQGRGFAVVADEVRSLASRTQASTEEIQQMIEKLQNGTDNAVVAMDKSEMHVNDSVESTKIAGDALTSIAESITKISDMSSQIATAVEEQGNVSEEINTNMANIYHASEKTSQGAEQTSKEGKKVASLAVNLGSIVSRFKV
ncbi:methyl-accepting chemotaxis protein [Vibrio aquimaris]|uniref:Methyl-accepting chemotaxis protein McpS n=1 Tax=Vibrio aquimaris TaxID=2587862 RepID=A0A5P9CQ75_9VIBR|nr:methyl-accepting chemotaxis protein [Vibrio aquimaris]QFT28091.1 Methyl-accepting chemotaxis protein McpS [Vibrio aquimaris]